MKLARKDFLKGLGTVALGASVAPILRGEAAASSPAAVSSLPVFDARRPGAFWRGVRALYDRHDDFAYLNCGGLGPASRPVLDKYREVTAHLEVKVETGHSLLDPARKVAAEFFGADEDEICFVRNTSEGNSIIACGLDLKAGDEVIFESHAHPGGSLPWLNRAHLHGIVVRTFAPDPTSAEGNLERIAALIGPRTKVIQVSHVTAPTGILMPVKAIARLAREKGCWFHVDGAQSGGMLLFSLHDIGCDSFATSGHKWLGAPRETGLLYIRHDRINDVDPSHVGAYTSNDFDFSGRLVYVAGVKRHEYATRNAASIEGVARAMHLQTSIGRQRISEFGAGLAQRVHRGLAKIPRVTVLTPSRPELRGSMTTFTVEGATAATIFEFLYNEFQLRCRPVTEDGLQAVRVSTHVFNTAKECDRVVAGVAAFVRTL